MFKYGFNVLTDWKHATIDEIKEHTKSIKETKNKYQQEEEEERELIFNREKQLLKPNMNTLWQTDAPQKFKSYCELSKDTLEYYQKKFSEQDFFLSVTINYLPNPIGAFVYTFTLHKSLHRPDIDL